jgi:hypothetical protein
MAGVLEAYSIRDAKKVLERFAQEKQTYIEVVNISEKKIVKTFLEKLAEKKTEDKVAPVRSFTRLNLLGSSIFGSNGNCVDRPSTPVPEPGTMLTLGFALLGLVAVSRKRFRKTR